MRIDILTLFPEMFKGPFDESILKRAQDEGLVKINIHDLRKWTSDRHRTVDDRPFGGGVGMVLKVDVIDKAVNALKSEILNSKPETNSKSQSSNFQNNTPTTNDQRPATKTILLDAGGKTFNQKKALQLSKLDNIILICGHYEGVDYRVHKHIADEVVSIGDYILTGGEIPAMVLVDSTCRLIPGVIVKPDATKYESFSPSYNLQPTTYNHLLEHPQYTRPEKYLSWNVPKVLMSGNHKEIEKWKNEKSLQVTKNVRPDLMKEKII